MDDDWGCTDIVNTRDDQVWTEILPYGPVHMVWVDGGKYPESVRVRLYMKTQEDRDSIRRVLEVKALTTPGIEVKKKNSAVTKKEGHENCNAALEVVMNRTSMAAVADYGDPGTLADCLYSFCPHGTKTQVRERHTGSAYLIELKTRRPTSTRTMESPGGLPQPSTSSRDDVWYFHAPTAYRLPPTAYRLPPTAYRLPSHSCRMASTGTRVAARWAG